MCQGAAAPSPHAEERGRIVAIALGANLGDAASTLREATADLSTGPALTGAIVSGLYGTAPVGPPQPDYLNAVLVARSSWEPYRLLRWLQGIEAAHGRQRDVRWGPRTLDLDLLLVGDSVCCDEELTLPHPGIASRGFVLVPLCDVLPDAVHPTLGVPFRTLLARWTLRTVTPDRQVWAVRAPSLPVAEVAA